MKKMRKNGSESNSVYREVTDVVASRGKKIITVGVCLCAHLLLGALTPSDMSMSIFKSGRVREPTVFKVMISVADRGYYWDGQIENYRDKFWAVRMRPVQSRDHSGDVYLYCYVKKSSEAGKVVAESLKDGGEHSALVQVRYSDKPQFDQCCVMDAIEMSAGEMSEDVKVKFGATRITVTKSEQFDYLQGKIAVTFKSKLKAFAKPVLRVVVLADENGSRVVRDSIVDEPDLKVISESDSIEHDTTTAGNDRNEPPHWHHYIEEISANQSEVSADRFKSVTYVGLPIGTETRKGLKGMRTQHMFGYCKFDKQENAKMLGYRIEVWYKGGCVAAYDTLRASDLKKLQLPDDWHVSFKHPQKFKYRSPFSNKTAVRY